MDEARCPSLSLILPAYNEAAGIAEAVAEADDALARFAGDYEILVVEDGSRHRTRRHGHSKVSLADIPRTLAVLLPFWWSKVLFAGDISGQRTEDRGERTGFLSSVLCPLSCLLMLAALLFFCRLRT